MMFEVNVKGILTKDEVYYTTQEVQFAHMMIMDCKQLKEKDVVKFALTFKKSDSVRTKNSACSIEIFNEKEYVPEWFVESYDKERIKTSLNYFERYRKVSGLIPCIITGSTNTFEYFDNIYMADYFSDSSNIESVKRYIRMMGENDRHLLNDVSKTLMVLANLYKFGGIKQSSVAYLQAIVGSRLYYYLSSNNNDYDMCDNSIDELLSKFNNVDASLCKYSNHGELINLEHHKDSNMYIHTIKDGDKFVIIKDKDGMYLSKIWTNFEGLQYAECRDESDDYIFEQEPINKYTASIVNGILNLK